MALVKLTCMLVGVMSFIGSIQGASFSPDKNSTFTPQLDRNSSAFFNILKESGLSPSDLQPSASDNVASVVGTSVTSTSGSSGQVVPPSVPATGFRVPAYAAPVSSPVPTEPFPFNLGGLGGLRGPGGLGVGPIPALFSGLGGNFGLDVNAGGYFPIVEKVIVIVGGGILLLILLALVQGSLLKGGMLNNFGRGVITTFVDPADFVPSGSVSAAGSASFNKNLDLNNRVQDSINRQF